MLVVRERQTPWSGLLLIGSGIALLVFGSLFLSSPDWLSGGLTLVAGVGAARLSTLRWRLHRNAAPPRAASRTSGLFVARATHMIGARYREGFVAIGRDGAGFVPTSR